MELLAPAGSKESFIAAIRGGAQAVYCGVENFNARLGADNLNFHDLEVLADYAHARSVKVYLAFNILVKQAELSDVLRKLERIASIAPDGIIVQDIGLADILRKRYPALALHASTQMAVHNGKGLAALRKMGFTRAVLARELSLAELKAVAHKPPVELEVFCHGALCFSISGLCLFSSALGAMSGNRGRCLQPCRRIWKNGKGSGYVFSPKDLQLAAHVPTLKELGITALKIEGRMRSSEYVYTCARAYRMLVDAKKEEYALVLPEALRLLSNDYAREKTTCLFTGTDGELFMPGRSPCLGKNIGRVESWSQGLATITVSEPLQKGDRLRLADPVNDTTKTVTLKEFSGNGTAYTFALEGKVSPGLGVFKAGSGGWDEKSIEKEVDVMFRLYERGHPRPAPETHAARKTSGKGSQRFIPRAAAATGNLWITIDTPEWLEHLPVCDKNVRLVFSLSRENIHLFRNLLENPPFPVERAACELPPFIGQRELPEYKRLIDGFISSGVRAWIANNISHLELLDDGALEKIAGHFLYSWNAPALTALKENGVSRYTVSWEDDLSNIKSLAAAGAAGELIVSLFGYPQIARSRMLAPGFLACDTVSRKKDMEFRVRAESGSAVLVPSAPFMIFSEKGSLSRCGIRNFAIDLTSLVPDRRLWDTLIEAYRGKRSLPETFTFNFRRGVK